MKETAGDSQAGSVDWAKGSLVLVAGKGGSGKTTVSAALGVVLSRSRRCLVLSSDAEALARVFDREMPSDPVPVAWAPGLWVGRLDLWQALEDFGRLRMGAGRLVRAVVRSRSVRGFLDALPGLGALALLGRSWHYCRASSSQGDFDTVILDVSGRGHLSRLLGQPTRLLSVLPSGPLRRDLEELSAVLSDPGRSKLVAVTISENYSVVETMEMMQESARMARGFDLLVVNGLWPVRLQDCVSFFDGVGLDSGGLVVAAHLAARRVLRQQAALDRVVGSCDAVVRLPFVTAGTEPSVRLSRLAVSFGPVLSVLSGADEQPG